MTDNGMSCAHFDNGDGSGPMLGMKAFIYLTPWFFLSPRIEHEARSGKFITQLAGEPARNSHDSIVTLNQEAQVDAESFQLGDRARIDASADRSVNAAADEDQRDAGAPHQGRRDGHRIGDDGQRKIRPKSRSELTPEEKLLHAIFGRAGEDVKNDSLEVPSGVEGVVIDTQRFSRRASLSDEERKAMDKEQRR